METKHLWNFFKKNGKHKKHRNMGKEFPLKKCI
jgi:hypothetical protein